MNDHLLAAALLALTVFAANLTPVRAQNAPADQGAPAHGHEAAPQTEGKPGPTLTAVLVDADKKAQKHAATVSVRVKGVKLVDPALDKEKAVAGHAHLHYRVDDGPVIATTAPKLSFHELKSGEHTITVMLAASDHSPLGPQQTMTVSVP